MSRVKSCLIATIGLAFAATVFASVGSSDSESNADAVPRPTNVNVVNKPTVEAEQKGAWNVGISGTPNVNVANTPTVNLAPGTTVQVSLPPGTASPVAVGRRYSISNVGDVTVLEIRGINWVKIRGRDPSSGQERDFLINLGLVGYIYER